jgi:hypothetical protein
MLTRAGLRQSLINGHAREKGQSALARRIQRFAPELPKASVDSSKAAINRQAESAMSSGSRDR